MGELQKLSDSLGELAEVVDLEKLAHKLTSFEADDVFDADEVFHALSGAVEWLGDATTSARKAARWLVPLGAGAAAYAALRSAPRITHSLREHVPEPLDLQLGSRVRDLAPLGGGEGATERRPTDPRTLKNHLRARAAHREQRRKRFSRR